MTSIFFFNLVSAIFILGNVVQAQNPTIVAQPSDATVVTGSDIILKCVVENLPVENDMVQWTKNGFALGFDRDLAGFARYSMVGDESIGEYHLQILNASLVDEGNYECQVTMHMMRTDTAKVTILVPSQGPKIDNVIGGSNDVIDVLAYSDNLITCRSWNGKPAATLEWYKDGVKMESNVTYAETDASQKLRNSTATLRIWPTERDDRSKYECIMTVDPSLQNIDPNGLSSRRARVELNVQKPPTATLKLSSTEVKEKSTLYASCDSTNSKPAATSYIWFIGGEKMEGESSSSISFANMNRTMNGVVLGCQSVNSVGLSELSNVAISVLYAPILITAPVNITTNMSSTVNMSCSWDSNPRALITWYKKSGKDKVTWVGDGELLTVDVKDQTAAGIYTCVADAQGVGIQSVSARLDVLGPPLFDSPSDQHATLGRKGTVECTLKSMPGISRVTWNWERKGSPMSLSNNETGKIEQNGQQVAKYSSQMTYGGSTAYLMIYDVTTDDMTQYNCTVHNVYGSGTTTMTLSETPSPQAVVMIGSIVGGVVGAILLLLFVVLIAVCCIKRRRQQKSTTFQPEEESLRKVQPDIHDMENGVSRKPNGKLVSPDADSDNPSTSASISSRDGARESLVLDYPTHNDDGYHTEEANSWNRAEKQSPESSPARSSRDDYSHVKAPLLTSQPMTSSPMGGFERGSPYNSSESESGNPSYLKYNVAYDPYAAASYGPNGVVELPPPRPRDTMSPVNMYVGQQPYPNTYYHAPTSSSSGYRSGAYPPSYLGQQRPRAGSTTPSVISSHRSVTPSPAYAAMLGRATPLSVLGDRGGYYMLPTAVQPDPMGPSSSQSSLDRVPSSGAAADPYENAGKMSQISSRVSQASRSSEFLGNRQLTARMATNV